MWHRHGVIKGVYTESSMESARPGILARLLKTQAIARSKLTDKHTVQLKITTTPRCSTASVADSLPPKPSSALGRPKRQTYQLFSRRSVLPAQRFRVIGTAVSLPAKKQPRPRAALEKSMAEGKTVDQADIQIEIALRRLGTTREGISKHVSAIGHRIKLTRSFTQQFISLMSETPRAHSELRIRFLNHVLDTSPIKKPVNKLIAQPLDRPFDKPFADLDFPSSPLSISFIKPTTTHAQMLTYQSSVGSQASQQSIGLLITDPVYCSLLHQSLEQVLRLAGIYQIESFYDASSFSVTCYLTGRDAPISDCCKFPIYVLLTESKGCKVVCTKRGCLSNTVSNFVLPLSLRQKLWQTRPLVKDPMPPNEVSHAIATGKFKSFSFRNASRGKSTGENSRGLEATRWYDTMTYDLFTNQRLKYASFASPRRSFHEDFYSSLFVPPNRTSKVDATPLHHLIKRRRRLNSAGLVSRDRPSVIL